MSKYCFTCGGQGLVDCVCPECGHAPAGSSSKLPKMDSFSQVKANTETTLIEEGSAEIIQPAYKGVFWNRRILENDNTAVRLEQIENLKRLKEGRNQAEVDKALEAITECVKTGKGNLLELAVEAARVRATLGEISYACEKIVGRYKAIIRTISGVYSSESKNDSDFKRACELAEKFAKKEGRQPRIMVAKMGQDGHDRGAKVVATGYADCGFDVDMGPLFQTPAEAAREAVENDVHVVGVSSLAAGHKTLIPQIMEELKKLGREDIVVIAGGVIPAQDYDFLYKAGVAAIFGPGTPVAKAACQILEILMDEE